MKLFFSFILKYFVTILTIFIVISCLLIGCNDRSSYLSFIEIFENLNLYVLDTPFSNIESCRFMMRLDEKYRVHQDIHSSLQEVYACEAFSDCYFPATTWIISSDIASKLGFHVINNRNINIVLSEELAKREKITAGETISIKSSHNLFLANVIGVIPFMSFPEYSNKDVNSLFIICNDQIDSIVLGDGHYYFLSSEKLSSTKAFFVDDLIQAQRAFIYISIAFSWCYILISFIVNILLTKKLLNLRKECEHLKLINASSSYIKINLFKLFLPDIIIFCLILFLVFFFADFSSIFCLILFWGIVLITIKECNKK